MKHATSPPLSEDATSAPTFADVARFIAGPDAPTWLVEHFARWGPSLMLDCSAEKMQPTKVAARKLDISLHTVTFLIESLFRKLGARSRAEDVARGLARRKRSSMHNCARRAPRNCDE